MLPPAAPAREFIVDGGAGLYCAPRSNLCNVELQTLEATTSIALQAANGMVDANQVVQVYVQELELRLWALILDSTPCLLSMGRFCRQHGFAFTQEGANPPALYKDDIRVYSQLTFDVPYITAVSDTQLHDSADVSDEMFPVPDQSEPSNDNLLNCDNSEQDYTPCDTTPHSKRKWEATPRNEKPSADHYLTHFPKNLTAKFAMDAKCNANLSGNAASIMLQTT